VRDLILNALQAQERLQGGHMQVPGIIQSPQS
jgi:hypothetical protein